jgi:hypothetical protein
MLNEKKFRSIYDEFLTSGLTIRDFCANQQMNGAKFYYWQNKLNPILTGLALSSTGYGILRCPRAI